MFYGLAMKAGCLLLVAVMIYAGINTFGRLINNHINDYISTRETLTAKQIEVAEMTARNDYLKQLAKVTDALQQEKNTLMETTHRSLLDARAELYSAQNRWTIEDIRQRASTTAGNHDLSTRAARATNRKKTLLEELSEWGTVYETPVAAD